MECTELFRPVGPEELALAYARQIARDWNVRDSGEGHVLRFAVRAAFLARYPAQRFGAPLHVEYWIPAEDLPEFNDNILGNIEVIARFIDPNRLAADGRPAPAERDADAGA